MRVLELPVASNKKEIRDLVGAVRALYLPCFTIQPELVSTIIGQDAIELAIGLYDTCKMTPKVHDPLKGYSDLNKLIFGSRASRSLRVQPARLTTSSIGEHSDISWLKLAAHIQGRILSEGGNRTVRMSLVSSAKLGSSPNNKSFEKLGVEHVFEGKIVEGSVTPFVAGDLEREDGDVLRAHHHFSGFGDIVRINEMI